MSPQGMMTALTPNIDRLLNNGSHTLQARSVRPTSSSSNWTSMITGAGVEQHGVTSNDWERDEFSIYPAAVGAENI
ncbi:alkaline phosphatase family protein, partial [Arthrospira platensis SPKY2]